MKTIPDGDKRLYVETYPKSDICYCGDLVLTCTFGGRYNAGTSANIIFSFNFFNQITHVMVYQDPLFRTF